MAQKIKPTLHRLGITKNWTSRWLLKRKNRYFLEEDYVIRKIVTNRLNIAGVSEVSIERTGSGDEMRVNIKSSKPGLVIGRGGKGIEDLNKEVNRAILKLRREKNKPLEFTLKINVEELKRTEVSAQVTAKQIAFDLEKRLPFRRIMKKTLESLIQNRDVKGAKIQTSGRLGGAEIARKESLSKGRMPLQSFRANIDYGEATAITTYGTIGVKVWVYKGDVWEDEEKNKNKKDGF